jgi:hypothetical protein
MWLGLYRRFYLLSFSCIFLIRKNKKLCQLFLSYSNLVHTKICNYSSTARIWNLDLFYRLKLDLDRRKSPDLGQRSRNSCWGSTITIYGRLNSCISSSRSMGTGKRFHVYSLLIIRQSLIPKPRK